MSLRHCVLKNLLIMFALCFILYLWASKDCPDAKKVAVYIADNTYIAILSCGALIVMKLFVTLFPTTLIFIIFGYLLPPLGAFFMCLFCIGVLFSSSYYRGKASNNPSPRGNSLKDNKTGVFITSMSVHCLRFFQCSTTGNFFGRIGAPYFVSLLGALVGMLPGIVLSLSLTDFLSFL